MFIRGGEAIVQATFIHARVTAEPAGIVRAFGIDSSQVCQKEFKNVRTAMDQIALKIQAGAPIIDLDNIERDENDPPIKTIELG